MLDCDIVLSEFELQSHYDIHSWESYEFPHLSVMSYLIKSLDEFLKNGVQYNCRHPHKFII